jgi:hypothetical protein
MALFTQHSPIHHNSGPRNKVTRSTSQEQNRSPQVLRCSPPLRRCPREYQSLVLFVLSDCSCQWGVDVSANSWSAVIYNRSKPDGRMYPGQMQLTCIPLSANSLLNAFVICKTPPFEAAYADTLYMPMKEVTDPMLMILPGFCSDRRRFAISWEAT